LFSRLYQRTPRYRWWHQETSLEASEEVTFTATLIQRDIRTGTEAPLNDQEVYIIASDLSRNLCTPGPDGTYTWTTTISIPGAIRIGQRFLPPRHISRHQVMK